MKIVAKISSLRRNSGALLCSYYFCVSVFSFVPKVANRISQRIVVPYATCTAMKGKGNGQHDLFQLEFNAINEVLSAAREV
jgi:hypothetical protein